MTRYFSIILISFAGILLAQKEFEPGYIIMNNVKTECLIKNAGWIQSPESIEFKYHENADIRIADAEAIDEFHIYETEYKYVSRNFQFAYNIPAKDHFLKVLLEGKASLFYYSSYVGTLYYFEVNDENLTLLHHKTDIHGRKEYDRSRFRAQLFESLKCDDLPQSRFRDLNYRANDLIKLFTDYNNCENTESINYHAIKKKGKFNLFLKAGTGILETAELLRTHPNNISKFQTKMKIGVEAEYVLPFKNNKLGAFVGSSYSSHYAEGVFWYPKEFPYHGARDMEFDYNMIEFSFGVRFYSYFSPEHRIYGSVSYSYANTLGGNAKAYYVDFETDFYGYPEDSFELEDTEYGKTKYPSFGIGYRYKNKFGLELNYSLPDIYLDDIIHINQHNFTASLTYNLF